MRLLPLLVNRLGTALRFLSTLLAFCLAGFVLFRHKVPWANREFGRLTAILKPVRLIHSGHMGDYVAWLTFGVALLGGLFALCVR